ncbi:RNA polymerase sigma-I factor [Tepidibacter hydrothermalis]|uniref:RNA polymerase sigma factor SigI n=1 Tax=Tepidibacter hydrothermalis TaxID=3036126 RepID=A0ABY8EHY9_9FIRM|nr:RNA polymerase sigma-I factor [Tepidibacter hydrothermalis]WFD10470.1 RNA polymerase sigma-I factor [Tepidibacter hydrothermalis]
MRKILGFYKDKTMEIKIQKIKNGDENLRNKFIEEYTPFIIKTLSKVLNKYIQTQNDDSFSVGMEAFNEAINKYEKSKGSFLNFAQLVISNRAKSYIKKESKENFENIYEVNDYNLNSSYKDFTEKVHLKLEMERFKKELLKFKIEIDELVNRSPKHIDSRENAINIATEIIKRPHILEKIKVKKRLPRKEIIEELNVSEKVIKTNRIFILSIIIILTGEFEIMKDYIGKKGGDIL